MEFVQSVGASVCVALVVTGILSVLIPGKTMEKTVQMAVGLFFLCSIVFPIAQGDWKALLDWEAPEAVEEPAGLSQTVDERVLALTGQNLEEQVGLLLQQQGIETRQVDVGVHIGEDNSITITEIRIILPGSGILNAPAAEELVEEQLGIRPEVDWEGNG